MHKVPGSSSCCRNSLPSLRVVCGPATSKDRDQMKSDGQQSGLLSQSIKLLEREGAPRGLPLQFLCLGVFVSSFVELS